MPIAVLRCTSLGLFAYFATARTAFAISGCVWFARQPHHAPHKLAKRPITHGFVLVEFLELQTSRKWVIPPRTNTKPRRGVLIENLLRHRQSTSILIRRKTTTSIPPQLAQVVNLDTAVRVCTELITPTLNPHCKNVIHMKLLILMDTEPDWIKRMMHASAGLCTNPRLFI